MNKLDILCAFTIFDLVDGLFVAINSTNKLFDYADAYEIISLLCKFL